MFVKTESRQEEKGEGVKRGKEEGEKRRGGANGK